MSLPAGFQPSEGVDPVQEALAIADEIDQIVVGPRIFARLFSQGIPQFPNVTGELSFFDDPSGEVDVTFEQGFYTAIPDVWMGQLELFQQPDTLYNNLLDEADHSVVLVARKHGDPPVHDILEQMKGRYIRFIPMDVATLLAPELARRNLSALLIRRIPEEDGKNIEGPDTIKFV